MAILIMIVLIASLITGVYGVCKVCKAIFVQGKAIKTLYQNGKKH